jgi:hypothetical protein
MSLRLALVLATCVATVAHLAAQSSDAPDRVSALQRLVFANQPAAQLTRVEAQLDLADVYAIGDGVEQDLELACGLAAIAGKFSDRLDDDTILARARRMRDELCMQVGDPEAALQLASCPRFGITPQTLPLTSGATLTTTRLGMRVESDTGIRESEWPAECGDIIASTRIVDVDPPGGTSWPRRQFLELLIWHQTQRRDGKVGDRTLVWKVLDLDRTELQADASVIVVKDVQVAIWPVPPMPQEIGEGATLRMLPAGQVQWQFARAPDLGSGLIAARE